MRASLSAHGSPVGHVVRRCAKRPPAQHRESVAESHQRGVLVTVHWLGGGKTRHSRHFKPRVNNLLEAESQFKGTESCKGQLVSNTTLKFSLHFLSTRYNT